ncbi:MAG: ATP-binding protein [Rhodospirillaceae bacterium]
MWWGSVINQVAVVAGDGNSGGYLNPTARQMNQPTRTQRHFGKHHLSLGAVIVVGYMAAHYGLSLLSFNLEIARNVSVWFLPGGLLFGCLMVARGRQVGWVMVGDFAARAVWSADLWSVPANMGWLTITTSLSPLIYAAITTALKSARIGGGFQSSGGVMALIIGMVLAPAIVAPLICLTYAWAGFFAWNDLPTLIPSFLIGDLVGIGTLAPLIMAVGSMVTQATNGDGRAKPKWWPDITTIARTVLLPAAAALVLYAVFHSGRPEIYTSGKFLMFIPLTVVALREGWRGASVAIVILNFSIVLSLAVHQVPIAVIDIQLLLLSYSLFALILGVITAERRQAERIGSLLAAAVHSSPNGVGIVELAAPEHRFLFVNDALVALMGRSADELRQTSWHDLHSDGVDAPILEDGINRLERRLPLDMNLRINRGDGQHILRVKGGPVIGDDGLCHAYLMTYFDITDEKRLELIEREREKLISIGHLASGVAHELNNLIHPVINFAKMVQKRLHADDKRSIQYLEHIRNCGIKAGDIVHKVLMFARETPASKTTILFGDAVQGAVELSRTRVPPTVTLELLNNVPTRLARINDTEVTQIVTNLVLNATHAVAKDGLISITVSSVVLPHEGGPVVALPAGPYLCLTVTDNGHGMDDDTRQRIFEPFFSTKPIGEGTGLGLSVVYGLITVAGGIIMVDSEVGIGTTFRVYLPDVTEADGGCHDADTGG